MGGERAELCLPPIWAYCNNIATNILILQLYYNNITTRYSNIATILQKNILTLQDNTSFMTTLQQNIMILKSYQNCMTFFEICGKFALRAIHLLFHHHNDHHVPPSYDIVHRGNCACIAHE